MTVSSPADQSDIQAAVKAATLIKTLYGYTESVSNREPEILAQLRQAAAQHPEVAMQIPAPYGQFMALLLRLIGAKKVLELGTFCGYSALWMALTIPADGTVITCDVSAETTAIGLPYWQTAGVADKIDLRMAPALDTLENLLTDGQANTFDFAFIDADKVNYPHYYEKCLALLRPGGLIVIDNTFWGGAVADPEKTDSGTVAIRELNQALHHDDRIELMMLPIGDGITLALKR